MTVLVPIVDTFKAEFIKMYRDILTKKAVKKYDFFNYDYLEKLFSKFEESKNYMLANKIFSLLVLQIWLNKLKKNKDVIKHPDIKKSIKIAENLMKGQGRILVRKSGTESKIRVMGESENKELLKKCVNLISKKIK